MTNFNKECLYFALGTAFNTLKDYHSAWTSFDQANAHGRRYGQAYSREAMERHMDAIIDAYPASQFNQVNETVHPSPQPVFICGMFRSGSTLTEQVLAAHPDFTPLGDSPFVPGLADSKPGFFPQTAVLFHLKRSAKSDKIICHNRR